MYKFLLFLNTLVWCINCQYFNNLHLTQDQIEIIDEITFRDVPEGAPGTACGIIIQGELVYTGYRGYANLSDSILINQKTRFNIASNAKQYVAIMVLDLIKNGKLNLDDDVRIFFENLYPEIKDKITIRHLLTHSSGIRDVYDLWSLKGLTWWEHTFSNDDAIELLTDQNDLNFAPGTEYLYSNSNYILLAQIIEKVSGVRFTEYSNGFFQSIGMKDTAFEADYTNIKEPIALPYFNFNTWTGYEWTWNVVGDGNLFSTMKDQILWEQMVQGYKTNHLLQEIIEISQQPVEGSNISNYGYGLEFSRYKGLDHTFHHGGTGAWKVTVSRFPSESVSIITMSNSGKTDVVRQNQEIINVVLDLASEPEGYLTQPERVGNFISIDEILGTYLTDNNYAFTYILKDGDLYLSRAGRNDVKLQREADNIFNEINDPAFKQEFTRNEKGELLVTAYYNTHGPFSLKKVEAGWENFKFKSLNRSYFNSETGVKIGIEHKIDTKYTINIGNYQTEGQLISPSIMLADGYKITIDSVRGKNLLFLNSDRAKNILFQ